MNRKTAWMLMIWLPLAGLAPTPASAEVPAELILEQLPDEIGVEERRVAEVTVSGELAAVRLASGIYLLERDAGGRWHPVTRIAAPGEAHFGDSMLLGSDTLLVAAPDTAGAGLGPGMAYVFQRHVGGSDHWGLVARLAPAAYPPPGAVEVRQLAPPAEAGPEEVAAAPPPEPPTAAEAEPATEAPEPTAETSEPAAGDIEPRVEEAAAEAPTSVEPEPTAGDVPPVEAAAVATPEPAAGNDPRFIVVANMREKPRALALASDLRGRGYPSEVHRNDRDFFIVTLARLPRVEARRMRAEAVAAGDIPPDSYLIVGAGFEERISP